MTKKKIGFIGSGNMASAIIGGILNAGLATKEDLCASDASSAAREKIESTFGIRTFASNKETADFADILFLSVKPVYIETVISDIKDSISPDTLVISIAAGQTLSTLEGHFGKDMHIIRTMPNTPALVGAGMAALSPNALVTEEEKEIAVQLFNSFGKCEIVPESLMDAVTGVSGSSPAYVYMFIEAMADAAVAEGMPRAQAYTFAAQSVLGSAKMVLETGKHPGELKDMVCSPAGTTIEAVAVLEKNGFRHAVIDAERACIIKSKEMSKK